MYFCILYFTYICKKYFKSISKYFLHLYFVFKYYLHIFYPALAYRYKIHLNTI